MGEDGGVEDEGQHAMSSHPGSAPLGRRRHIHSVEATDQRYEEQPGSYPGQADSERGADMHYDVNGGGQTDITVGPDAGPPTPDPRPLRLQGPVGPGEKHQQGSSETSDGNHQIGVSVADILTA